MTDTTDVLAKFGYVGPVVSVGFVFLATIVDPQFAWQSRSLSSIGTATGTSLFATTADQIAFDLFNFGLVAAALFGLPFAVALWRDAVTTGERAGVVLAALTVLGSAGVGVAYLEGPLASLHLLTALTFFFGVSFTLWAHGSGVVRRTGGEAGLGAIWLANVYSFQWVLWMLLEAFLFTGDGDTWTWFAVPEFVAAVVFGAWVVLQARRLLA